jgi:hypothetical protein
MRKLFHGPLPANDAALILEEFVEDSLDFDTFMNKMRLIRESVKNGKRGRETNTMSCVIDC